MMIVGGRKLNVSMMAFMRDNVGELSSYMPHQKILRGAGLLTLELSHSPTSVTNYKDSLEEEQLEKLHCIGPRRNWS